MALLHHRPEVWNMRTAYEHAKQDPRHDSPHSSDAYEYSNGSKGSTTPPTSYSGSIVEAQSRPIVHQQPRNRNEYVPQPYFSGATRCASPTSIDEERRTESVISIIESEDELDEADEEDLPEYSPPPTYTSSGYESTAIPSRPTDFSELFPSHRRLNIRHDDSTQDGNMNLRVDTEVKIHGRKCDMTLFHLRMHDLKNRDFSLRRYCRDSGREVCHSTRKHKDIPVQQRPGLQRSLSNALNSIRPRLEKRSSTGPAGTPFKRQDSGYGSIHSSDEDYRPATSGSDMNAQEQPLTNRIKLEFSNYAQMDVSLSKDKKRYEFNYWKYELAWKRVVDKTTNEVFFHLIDRKQSNKRVLAYIRPIPLTDDEAEDERFSGGWIPQCMMWIADDSIVKAAKDVADAVVASGLMALVDDSIRTRFQSEESKLLLIPTSKHQMGSLINEMFSRNDSKLEREHESAYGNRQSKASRVTSGSVRPSSRGH